MSQGILLTGLSLLSAVVEANPDMNEQNTPPLKEITVDIDHLLTNSSALNPELQELGIRCRLMLSVWKALAEVPHHTDKVDSELEEENNQLTKNTVFFVLHSKAFPIALRSSALAILTSCVEVLLCTMASYLPDLIESCLTILSIESLSPSTNHEPNAERSLEPNDDELFEYGEQFKELGKDEMADPTIRDSRHPVLRRSAIKFLRMAFLKSLNSPIEDYNKRMKSRVMIRTEDLMKVMRVLGYVKLIEKDGVCKALAEEFHEELESTFFKR